MGQEQNQIVITGRATLRQLEILGDNGEEEATGSKSGKGAGHPDTVFNEVKEHKEGPRCPGELQTTELPC